MSVFLLAGQRLIEAGNFTEEYALLFTWISIYAFSQTTFGEHKRRYPILIGAMLALNFLLRANNMGTAAVVTLLYLVQAWQQGGLLQTTKKSLWLLVGLLLILAPRDPPQPPWRRGPAANPWLLPMAAAVGLLLAAVLILPGLRQLMGLAGAGLPTLAAIAAVLALCLAWLALLRLAARRRVRARPLR